MDQKAPELRRMRWARRFSLLAAFGMLALPLAPVQAAAGWLRAMGQPVPFTTPAQEEEEHHSHLSAAKSSARIESRRARYFRRRAAGLLPPFPEPVLVQAPVLDAPARPRQHEPRFIVPRYGEPPAAV